MSPEYVRIVLRDYIDKELLDGQGSDLTFETELFELGIIDSFALIAFIDQEFGVRIPLEAVDPDDLSDIAALAELIVRNMKSGGPEAPSDSSAATYPFASLYVRPESPVVAVVFNGNRLPNAPLDARSFMQQSGFGEHNMLLIQDPYENGYNSGISAEYDDYVVSCVHAGCCWTGIFPMFPASSWSACPRPGVRRCMPGMRWKRWVSGYLHRVYQGMVSTRSAKS